MEENYLKDKTPQLRLKEKKNEIAAQKLAEKETELEKREKFIKEKL